MLLYQTKELKEQVTEVYLVVQPQAKVAGVSRMFKVKLRINFHKCVQDYARGIFIEVQTVHSLHLKANPVKTFYKFDDDGDKGMK